MARSKSNSNIKFFPLATIVIGVSAFIGYYLGGGSHPSLSSISPTPSPSSSASNDTTKQPNLSSRTASTRRANGDYTAPGAPKIQINEEKNPSLTDSTRSSRDQKSNLKPTDIDPEASQEDAPPKPKTASKVTSSSESTTIVTPDEGVPDPNPTTPPDTIVPTNSTDPDYEKIGTHTDAEATQEAAGTGTSSGSSTDKAQFRVQVGAFGQSRNARILADALRTRGYSANMREEGSGDTSVYKVQTGVYRTKAAANKAALELQRSGFPAYVSPFGP